ncbi:MAG TPA: hypothetical protein VHE37_02310 [Nevskiaceae bacterium]|nr:hypothetical protein [Nevskiaceae bacterium]
MQKIMTAVCLGTMMGAAMLAAAAGPADSRPETRAYFSYGFGAHQLPSNFHYGLRLDQDSRYAAPGTPAVMQVDMSGDGTLNARLNGVNLLSRNFSANQEEGATAAAATSYSVADWGLIVLGAAGVGYAGYEVSKSHKDDSSSSSTTGTSTGGGSTTGNSTTGGSTTGGLLGGGVLGGGSTTGGSTTGGSTTGGSTTGGVLGLAEYGAQSEASYHTRDYQEWLDGGTGQMGDLRSAH